MLTRQKTILALLAAAKRPLSPTMLVKLAFLLREETAVREDATFYDFVPYKYGPFSFALYRELNALDRNGYVSFSDRRIALATELEQSAREIIEQLSGTVKEAVVNILKQYGGLKDRFLVRDVYARYPWYAQNSELKELVVAPLQRTLPASIGVYTVGYEGKSVDSFFAGLIQAGIAVIADVRSNPISRKYGFARSSLSGIAKKLSIGYRHLPSLGLSSKHRAKLTDYESYQRLLDHYEKNILPKRETEIAGLAESIKHEPTALLCAEKDVRCCHRSRLADAVSRKNGLPVTHLS